MRRMGRNVLRDGYGFIAIAVAVLLVGPTVVYVTPPVRAVVVLLPFVAQLKTPDPSVKTIRRFAPSIAKSMARAVTSSFKSARVQSKTRTTHTHTHTQSEAKGRNEPAGKL